MVDWLDEATETELAESWRGAWPLLVLGCFCCTQPPLPPLSGCDFGCRCQLALAG